MIVIDGSILVSPYFEPIVEDLGPSEIVVPRLFKITLQQGGELFRTLVGWYGADEDIAWSTFEWAKSRMKDWVHNDDDGMARLAGGAGPMYRQLLEAFQNSAFQAHRSLGDFIADEIVQMIGLRAPILAIGRPQSESVTWSLLESTFVEQCTIHSLSSEQKGKRLEEVNLSLAVIAGLDPWLIEAIAPASLAWLQQPQAALSHCRFVAIDL